MVEIVMEEPVFRGPSKNIYIFKQDVSAEVAKIVDESADALMEAGIPIFKRGQMLVMALWEERRTDVNQMTKIAALVPMDIDLLDYTLNKKRVAVYQKSKTVKQRGQNPQRVFVEISAPERALRRLLGVKHWKFPVVSGIINCPTMRPDGSLLLTRGFDNATGFYAFWDGGLELPPIPENPTLEDARAAMELLLELIRGFPFVTDLDRSVALAAVMTPVLRVGFDLAPLFLLLAHVSGTGKSFMQDVISVIANGRRCPVINGSEEKAELDKQLGALLMEGTPIVALDNLDHDLKGSLLCQMVTQHYLKVRILGQSRMPEIEWRGMLIANGNNVRVAADLVRRTLVTNMDVLDGTPQEREQPETRNFDFDPVKEVLKNRGKFISAVLTIARAYKTSGQRVQMKNFGSFQDWSRVVRAPLMWLGMPDPLRSQEQLRRDDPVRSDVRELMGHWQQCLELWPMSYTAAEIVKKVSTVQGAEFDAPGLGQMAWVFPDFREFLIIAAGNGREISSRKLGNWLMRINGEVHGGYRIDIINESDARGNKYALQKLVP